MNIAVEINNAHDFELFQIIMLKAGAYWNGKEHGQFYNLSLQKTYYAAITQRDLQMNLYDNSSYTSIQRAGYKIVDMGFFKGKVKMTQNRNRLEVHTFAGIMGYLNSNDELMNLKNDLINVEIGSLFSDSSSYRFQTKSEYEKSKAEKIVYDYDTQKHFHDAWMDMLRKQHSDLVLKYIPNYPLNVELESLKSLKEEHYINQFNVSDIVITTTKTSITKLLKNMGKNIIKSDGICLINKNVKIKQKQ